MNEIEARRYARDLTSAHSAAQTDSSLPEFIQGAMYALAAGGGIEDHASVPAMAAEIAFYAGRGYEGNPLDGLAPQNTVAAAQLFIASEIDLHTRRRIWGIKPGEFEFEFGLAYEFTANREYKRTTVSEFIGGVAIALLERGSEDVEAATVTRDVAEVSFLVGRLMQSDLDDTRAFSELSGEVTDAEIVEASSRLDTLLCDISLVGGDVENWHPLQGVTGVWTRGGYIDYEEMS